MVETLVYVGTYTDLGLVSVGIYVCRMDQDSGRLDLINKIAGVENPSYLSVDPHHRYLYAVNELKTLEGRVCGAVSAFSTNPETGQLTFLNKKPSLGGFPCYVTMDKTGKYVLVANYVSGNVPVYAIQKDGELGAVTDLVQHDASIHNSRQWNKNEEGPHAHCVALDSANRYAFVPDLGLDRIMIYKFDSARGRLTPNDEPWAKVKSGSGPRHFTFHPSERYAYLINEISSTMTAFAYDRSSGALRETQTVTTLPEGFSGKNICADVQVDPSGKFLYGSNRGHDSIVSYEIDKDTGDLIYIGHWTHAIKNPRSFAIDPTGTHMLVANQDTNNIVTLLIDPKTGNLSETDQMVDVPTPCCVKIVKTL